MTKEIQHQVGSEIVKVQLTILKEFEECKEDMKSPFKNMKQVLPSGFDPNQYTTVIVKSEIYPEHRIPVLLSHKISGESVCHEVVNTFMKESYPGRKAENIETIFCNHFELQYKYIII